MKNIIEQIQEDDPSYDPLAIPLRRAHYSRRMFNAACDRIYSDGYYGPINPQEWAEQDGRKPYYVSSALKIVAKVLQEVESYIDSEDWASTGMDVRYFDADDIRAALVSPWYQEIYGTRYPRV